MQKDVKIQIEILFLEPYQWTYAEKASHFLTVYFVPHLITFVGTDSVHNVFVLITTPVNHSNYSIFKFCGWILNNNKKTVKRIIQNKVTTATIQDTCTINTDK